jgi:Mg2+-importing ATPase
MLPIQLLVQNLLYDVSQVSIPWDDVDTDYLKQPRKWDAGGIARFMVCIGPISSIFDVVTFLLMWNVFHANTVERQSLFQSGWFVVGLLTQTLIVHMIRTQHIPFIQSRAATPVIVLTASIMAFGIYLPFSSLGEHLGMVPLPLSYFGWLAAILLSYCVLTQLIKTIYIRHFKQWL